MKRSVIGKLLLMGAVTSIFAMAEITVDKSNGMVTFTSDSAEKGTVKIVGPNDEVIVNGTFEGTFSWTPGGEDGAYRYDVRAGNDYAGGSIEVRDGKLATQNEEAEEE